MTTPPKVILTLPLPRVVTGTPRRCRGPERVAVLDDVPVLVRNVTSADAPLTFTAVAERMSSAPADKVPYYVVVGHFGYLN